MRWPIRRDEPGIAARAQIPLLCAAGANDVLESCELFCRLRRLDLRVRADEGKVRLCDSPFSDAGLSALMSEVNGRGSVYVICDSYGGSIASVAPDATAFAHRSALYCIQYGSSWTSPSDTPSASATCERCTRRCDRTCRGPPT